MCWHTIGTDVTGPLTETTNGNKYIIAAIDYFSKYLITKATPNYTAFTTAKFLFEDVICKHGLFYKLISDQGRNFESKVIEELTKLLKIKKVKTSAYNPKANGEIERINKTIKQMLKNYVNEFHTDWDEYLCQITYAYNTSIHTSTGFSPFEVIFARKEKDVNTIMSNEDIDSTNLNTYNNQLYKKQQIIHQIVKAINDKSHNTQAKNYDNNKLNNKFKYKIGSKVLLSDETMKIGQTKKLTPAFKNSIYEIIEIFNNNRNFKIKNNIGKTFVVNYNRLKPFQNNRIIQPNDPNKSNQINQNILNSNKTGNKIKKGRAKRNSQPTNSVTNGNLNQRCSPREEISNKQQQNNIYARQFNSLANRQVNSRYQLRRA